MGIALPVFLKLINNQTITIKVVIILVNKLNIMYFWSTKIFNNIKYLQIQVLTLINININLDFKTVNIKITNIIYSNFYYSGSQTYFIEAMIFSKDMSNLLNYLNQTFTFFTFINSKKMFLTL